MPWTETARRGYARASTRYASDLTDREWELVSSFLPPPKPVGRPRTTDLREVFNAVLYLASSGCQWRMLPKDFFPPVSTAQRYFYYWRDRGLIATIRFHLAMAARELEGRDASPSAGIIDSQGVRCAAKFSELSGGGDGPTSRSWRSCFRPAPAARQ